MFRRILVGLSTCAVLGSGLAFVVTAQDSPTPEQMAAAAADTRQSVFKLLRFNLGPVAAMARGDIPFDADIAERNALRIASLAPMIPDLFATDTRGFDIETEALDIIWENPDEFRSRAQGLVDAANTFADIAANSDTRTAMGAFRNLGGACANCHDTFRVDND